MCGKETKGMSFTLMRSGHPLGGLLTFPKEKVSGGGTDAGPWRRRCGNPREVEEGSSAQSHIRPRALTLVGDGANAQDVRDGVRRGPGARHGH